MSDSQEFLAHLAEKLGRPTPTSVQPVEFEVPYFRLTNAEERVDTLLNMWESLGGKGVKAQTPQEAAQALKIWFGDLQPEWPSHSIITWKELPDFAQSTLEQLNWSTQPFQELSSDRTERIHKISEAQLGVTGADYGIVQSGTLVLKSNPQRGRSVSLVPIRHLAFLAASSIRDELSELMAEFSATDAPPASIELISGPSRTSDIEMDLSIGVHGPVEAYLVVMLNQ